jgi:hypothetical protein
MRVLLFVLVLSFVGCSGSVGPFEVSPVKAAPTCDAVKAHRVYASASVCNRCKCCCRAVHNGAVAERCGFQRVLRYRTGDGSFAG